MSNPHVLITGGSRGIGLAIAKYLLKEGHKVFLVARTKEPLEKLKEEFPGKVELLAGDLKNFEVGFGEAKKDAFRRGMQSWRSMCLWA